MGQNDGALRQTYRSERALRLADFTRSADLMDTVRQVENDLAETMRATAAHCDGKAAARRLRLAEDATQGAQAAARASERLHQQARRWAKHVEAVELPQALDHAAAVLTDLDRAESDIADILTDLASYSGPDLTVRRLADEASAAAQHARDLTQALHQLARTRAAGTPIEGNQRWTEGNAQRFGNRSRGQRLADIDRRLAELRQARAKPPAGDTAPQSMQRVQRAREADRQRSVVRSRQLVEKAFGRAAVAHDRAAEAHEKMSRAGIGDAAEHKHLVAVHRAAAEADRQRAQEIRSRVVGLDPRMNSLVAGTIETA